MIQKYSVLEPYREQRWYLSPSDRRKYWAMTTHKWQSRIIDRTLAADNIERLRREWQVGPEA
jgi:hypothetical protein